MITTLQSSLFADNLCKELIVDLEELKEFRNKMMVEGRSTAKKSSNQDTVGTSKLEAKN